MRTLLFALTVAVCMQGQPAKSKLTDVDRIFAAFNTHTPGCAVGVADHGTVALRAGYGMADLERSVPVSADTVFELAGRISNPYQKQPIDGAVLQETVNRYNSFVTSGIDADFDKPTPLHTISKPPFYAAWATPILHDSLTGLRTDTHAQVIDIRGEVIPGLYGAGESQGGFAQHGLGRCLVFGRVAGRHAAQRNS